LPAGTVAAYPTVYEQALVVVTEVLAIDVATAET
jgi:hypothetical protein